MKTILFGIVLTLLSLWGPLCTARAQSTAPKDLAYPTKSIRLIVPQAAGGSNDIMARALANYLTMRLGKPVIVDNRPGGDGLIGTDIVAHANPDGYTLLLASAAFTMNPAVRKIPYNPLTAFDWVGMIATGPTVLTVGASFHVSSVKEILEVAKNKPGVYTMASAGGFQHFASALFRSLSGNDYTILLYKGGFPAMVDVMGGQAHMTVGSIVQSIPHLRSGKLIGIATGSLKRAATLPHLPTIDESGLTGYDAANWWAIATPSGTPTFIINRLSTQLAQYLELSDTQNKFIKDGAEASFKSSDQMRKMIVQDLTKWAKIAKDSHLQPD